MSTALQHTYELNFKMRIFRKIFSNSHGTFVAKIAKIRNNFQLKIIKIRMREQNNFLRQKNSLQIRKCFTNKKSHFKIRFTRDSQCRSRVSFVLSFQFAFKLEF